MRMQEFSRSRLVDEMLNKVPNYCLTDTHLGHVMVDMLSTDISCRCVDCLPRSC
jgi:hypothetical protein